MHFIQRSSSIPLRTVKFTITPANMVRGSETDIDAEVSISRDGKHIAYVESQGGQLWIRDIDQENARPVPGAVNVYQVFWSPDNQWLGYAVRQGDCMGRGGCDLVKLPVSGGTPVSIAKLAGLFRRAWWSSDGETIVFCDTSGMYTVSAKGGPLTRIVEHTHIEHPSFLDLPGGRSAILYQAVEGPSGHGIYVRLPGEGKARLITMSRSSNPYPAYSATGHIVYVEGEADQASIWALPFSLDTLQATGKPFPIVPHGSSPMVSATGTLVYSDVPSGLRQLAWVNRTGEPVAKIGEVQRVLSPRLSPDGKKLAVEIRDPNPELWIHDLERSMASQLTSDKLPKRLGVWTPSGDQITYSAIRDRQPDIFSKPLGGEPHLLFGTPAPELPLDWSPDGRFLMYETQSREMKTDLLYRERRRDGTFGEAVAFLKTPRAETAAQFSPDGRFLAYTSDESGSFEVYVRDFPRQENKWQVSNKRGVAPRWRKDGKELFYVEGQRLMAVSVSVGSGFTLGTPVPLFEKRSLASIYHQYDVSPDGKRFVVLDRPTGDPPLSIHVVHNWFEEFRGRQN
jgi:Tol biopolymer transport system component